MAKAIQDNNTLYNILSPLVQFGMRCHYDTFDVHGLENLPTDGSYIIAPCHQQALMEPLAVLNFAPKSPVFLARADIFAKPVVRAILTFLKILPVYRIRDGKGNLSKNNEIFDLSRNVLLDGFPLCLMAEGRHNDRHHLLPLVKGMFRIAGETQLKLGDHPLYIVPTGIDFDEYERPYSNLVVNIGKPIPVQPYMDTFRENEPVALNQMRDALSSALMPLMHDIRSDANYEEILTLCHVLNKELRQHNGLKNNAWNRFHMRQRIANTLDRMEAGQEAPFNDIIEETRRYKGICQRLRINEKIVTEHWSLAASALSVAAVAALVAAMAVVPAVRWVVLFLILCYPLPFLPTYLIPRKIIKDPQFRSSINFGIRFLFGILYTIVIGIVMACTGGAWMAELADIGAWWGLVAVAVVYVGAICSATIVNGLKGIWNNARYWVLRLVKKESFTELHNSLDKLQDLVPEK